jgi:GNAT superfamily N-acetyltransferase
VIRPARVEDVPVIVTLIGDLADFERARHEVQIDATALEARLFGADPAVFAHVAEVGGAVVGFALWFLTFSTWVGRHGIYLEDLYVRPEHRGAGHGRALLRALAEIAVERGYGRIEWSVLDWNDAGRQVYRALAATELPEWIRCRLDGVALKNLATGVRANIHDPES